MDLGRLFAIFMSAVFVQNYIFSRFLGLCPYVGVSKDTSSAMGMGFAVVFVMTMASLVTWVLYSYVLMPLDLTYLKIVAFILVIASFVQFVEMFLKKTVPALHKSLGIYLPLITTNCAVLGVAFLNITDFESESFGLVKSALQGFFAGAGFMLAMIIMSGIREKLEFADIPESMKGLAIVFITASLISIAFMGFSGFQLQ
ncbi:MAG: RnfABCDGE type electron transport complex subunit A [Candidatus Aureabacteria bacterium]|nr:RnfABCDGE type electron transport complex subunit A [Candidatus Auribacterota bacterium]MCK5654896.1 RnfABCDGE type electron transport complex subunit A [Candidatus Auribacterota bacterium]